MLVSCFFAMPCSLQVTQKILEAPLFQDDKKQKDRVQANWARHNQDKEPTFNLMDDEFELSQALQEKMQPLLRDHKVRFVSSVTKPLRIRHGFVIFRLCFPGVIFGSTTR